MFVSVPVQVWMLLVFGLLAWPAILNIRRYCAASPDRWSSRARPQFEGAPTSTGFTLSIVVLIVLVGLSAFIFTPAASTFVRSPNFPALLVVACAITGLFFCVDGLVKGEAEPLVRGTTLRFSRDTQPRGYWASMLWNAFFTGLCLFVAFKN